MNVLFLA